MGQRNSLAGQWLRPCVLTAKGLGSIPDQGNKIAQALWYGQKETKWTKDLNRPLTKEDRQQINICKEAPHHMPSGKGKLKPP